MHYRYSAKDPFDAAKASLKKQQPNPSQVARPLFDAMNYGSHFPGFDAKVKFRAKSGGNVRIGNSPLYSREPAAVVQRAHGDPAPAQVDGPAADEPAPPAVDRAPEAATSFPFFDDAPAVEPRKPRLSTAMLSGAVGVAVAVIVGLGVAGGSVFNLKLGAKSAPQAAPPSTALPADPATPLHSAAPASNGPLNSSPPVAPADTAAEPAAHPSAPTPVSQPRETASVNVDNGAQVLPPQPVPKVTPPKKKAAKKSPPTARAYPDSRPHGAHPARKRAAPKRQRRGAPATPSPYSDDAPLYTARANINLSTRLARCERIASIFERERCKWRLCDRRWGRDGCPAYKTRSLPSVGALASEHLTRELAAAEPRPAPLQDAS